MHSHFNKWFKKFPIIEKLVTNRILRLLNIQLIKMVMCIKVISKVISLLIIWRTDQNATRRRRLKTKWNNKRLNRTTKARKESINRNSNKNKCQWKANRDKKYKNESGWLLKNSSKWFKQKLQRKFKVSKLIIYILWWTKWCHYLNIEGILSVRTSN